MQFLIVSNINWDAIAGIASAFSVIGAFVALIIALKNVKETRLYNSMNLATNKAQRFDEMKIERKRFATNILRELNSDYPNVESIIPTSCAVLEFFEDLGYLTRRGLVDHGIIWNHFFWWIKRYHYILTELFPNCNCIVQLRKIDDNDPQLYQEFEYLFSEMQKHDLREKKPQLGETDDLRHLLIINYLHVNVLLCFLKKRQICDKLRYISILFR